MFEIHLITWFRQAVSAHKFVKTSRYGRNPGFVFANGSEFSSIRIILSRDTNTAHDFCIDGNSKGRIILSRSDGLTAHQTCVLGTFHPAGILLPMFIYVHRAHTYAHSIHTSCILFIYTFVILYYVWVAAVVYCWRWQWWLTNTNIHMNTYTHTHTHPRTLNCAKL